MRDELKKPRVSREFPAFTVDTAMDDMITDNVMTPDADTAFSYIERRLVEGGFTEKEGEWIKKLTKINLGVLHTDLLLRRARKRIPREEIEATPWY